MTPSGLNYLMLRMYKKQSFKIVGQLTLNVKTLNKANYSEIYLLK